MSDFGLIETIKVINGRPVFRNLHVKRLHRGLQLLNVAESEYKLEDRILRLLKYECVSKGLKNSRLRIEVQKNRMHEYLPDISALKWNCTLKPIEETRFTWDEEGVSLTLFPKHKKLLDQFLNLKHTERSLYEKALEYARGQNFDDALVLNENNKLADAGIYNVYIVNEGKIYTPPLPDGPVAGVLRELLLSRLETNKITERSISVEEIYQADEIFLSNALKGIRRVSRFEDRKLASRQTALVFEEFKSIVAEQFGEHLV